MGFLNKYVKKPDAHTPIDQVALALKVLLQHHPDPNRDETRHRQIRVLEPSAGKGNVIQAIRDSGVDAYIVAVERNPKYRKSLLKLADEVHCPCNFLLWSQLKHTKRFDLIIGNPPYGKNIETRFVTECFDLLLPGMGMLYLLLKLSFAESIGRYESVFSKRQAKGMLMLARRIKFYKNKTDRYSYCWFLWSRKWGTSQWHTVIDNQIP